MTQKGGAERVALALLDSFPGSPLVTSLFNPASSFPGFSRHPVRTSRLQRVPAFRRDPRLALPLLASAWENETITSSDADVVIASSSGWAHGVTTTPDVRKIVYCHNPARWLYQPDEYAARENLSRLALGPIRKSLLRWDRSAALSADRYLANSTVVAERIHRVYGIHAEVVPPPVSVDVDGDQDPAPGLQPGFLLTVARSRAYKNTAMVEDAVSSMGGERLVVVGASEVAGTAATSGSVTRLGIVSDARLRWLYANARALVSVSYEDFGLTPLEANAFGTPAVLLRAGGFLDTLDPGRSGIYIEENSVHGIQTALSMLPDFRRSDVRQHADKYSERNFRLRLNQIISAVVDPSGRVAGPMVRPREPIVLDPIRVEAASRTSGTGAPR